MTIMDVLVGVCIWILGFYKLEALGALMAFLKFSLQIVANLLRSFLYLFDTIVELHAMDETKCLMTFSLKSKKWIYV